MSPEEVIKMQERQRKKEEKKEARKEGKLKAKQQKEKELLQHEINELLKDPTTVTINTGTTITITNTCNTNIPTNVKKDDESSSKIEKVEKSDSVNNDRPKTKKKTGFVKFNECYF